MIAASATASLASRLRSNYMCRDRRADTCRVDVATSKFESHEYLVTTEPAARTRARGPPLSAPAQV
jgi:hypothetical protein